jgi:uroporphyrinogen-III synthase
MNFESETLAGRIIAIPETRELDVFAGLLERRGARVVRCPMVAIHDAPDPAPVLKWSRALIANEFDDVIFLTGEGLRRMLSSIERNAPDLRDAFIAALGTTRKITRGPKPTRALREIGLQSDLAAAIPTTEGIIASLAKQNLKGRRIGVQLYGVDPNVRLVTWLEQAGAVVSTVAPYVYADAAEDGAVQSLATQLEKQEIDAIAFTSMQQVQRFFDLLGDDAARSALGKTFIAAIGPIVAESLAKRGVTVQLVPEGAYFLKPLTRALEEQLGPK